MKESSYKNNIRKAIEDKGGKCLPIITGEMTERGTPDIFCVYSGMPVIIEAKVFPNTPSDIQEERLDEWFNAGALSLVVVHPVHTTSDVVSFIEYYSDQNYYSRWTERNQLQEQFEGFTRAEN